MKKDREALSLKDGPLTIISCTGRGANTNEGMILSACYHMILSLRDGFSDKLIDLIAGSRSKLSIFLTKTYFTGLIWLIVLYARIH